MKGFAMFESVKRKDLKWYQKLKNIIAGKKHLNYSWQLKKEKESDK